MNINNKLNELLTECLKPVFECYSEIVEERYNAAIKETRVEFTSVKNIIGNTHLPTFFDTVKKNKIAVSADDKKMARSILKDFSKIDNLTSFRNLTLYIARVSKFEYPTGDKQWDCLVSSHLEDLKEFCTKLLRLNRSEFVYESAFKSGIIPNRIAVKTNLSKFITGDNFINLINFLMESLPEDSYVDWQGSQHELHHFVKSLCQDTTIIALRGKNKIWNFANAYFKIKGKDVGAQHIKDGKDKYISKENLISLNAAINNLLDK